ncbi:hypothetical protein BGZ76_011636 [Entomortierella beljakovae]|nr:hypothetical protein BGZ76_011636 [Entomortierella beljakovae]
MLGVFSLALSFVPSTVFACERECQVNVSHAFADKYQILSSDVFTILSQKVDKDLFYGITLGNVLTPAQTTDSVKLIQESVTNAQNAWDVTLFKTIFDTIFKDEPKFKGDCNHPRRVIQPPLGVNWTMPDCHNMDYICGNPPSICHFMPMIKHRIVEKLRYQLRERMDGDDSDLYANFIGPALQSVLVKYPALDKFSAALHGNLNSILEDVSDDLADFAEKGQWKREWDMGIKILLLTFP